MHFTKTVAIFISRIFAPAMIDALMRIAPSLETSINTVFIRVNQGSWINGVFDERFDGLLLHIGQQVDDHLSTTLNHARLMLDSRVVDVRMVYTHRIPCPNP